MRQTSILCVVVFSTVLGSIVNISGSAKDDASDSFSPADLHAFTRLEPIDTHAHVFKNDPAFRNLLQHLHLHLLDIVVANKDDATFPDLESKIAAAKAFVRDSSGQATLCTTFDPFKFSECELRG